MIFVSIIHLDAKQWSFLITGAFDFFPRGGDIASLSSFSSKLWLDLNIFAEPSWWSTTEVLDYKAPQSKTVSVKQTEPCLWSANNLRLFCFYLFNCAVIYDLQTCLKIATQMFPRFSQQEHHGLPAIDHKHKGLRMSWVHQLTFTDLHLNRDMNRCYLIIC